MTQRALMDLQLLSNYIDRTTGLDHKLNCLGLELW